MDRTAAENAINRFAEEMLAEIDNYGLKLADRDNLMEAVKSIRDSIIEEL